VKVHEEYVHDRQKRYIGFRVDTIQATQAELDHLARFTDLHNLSAELFLDYEVTVMGDVDFPALLLYYSEGTNIAHLRTMVRLYFES
jgi:hypothetical protein